MPNIAPVGLEPIAASQARPTVRVIIWNARGTCRLESDGRLPLIRVRGGASAPPSVLADRIRRKLGFDVAILRRTAPDEIETACLAGKVAAPAGFAWTSRIFSDGGRSDWERPEWLAESTAEVDRNLSRLGRRRTGPPAQMRHTSVTGLLRIPTDAGSLWFKAVLPLFAHEPAVIRWLGSLAHYTVPRVLAEGPGWWLAEEFPPAAASPATEPLIAVAETQIAVAGRVEELRASGCPTRPAGAIAADLAELATRTDLLAVADMHRLHRALPRLEGALAEIDSLDFPPTLVHGDISPGNLLWTTAGWLIYDWTDACIAHPFADLAAPLSFERSKTVAKARAANFAKVWTRVMSPACVERALRLWPVIGAAHQAASYRSITDAVGKGADQAGREQLIVFLRYWVRRLCSALGE